MEYGYTALNRTVYASPPAGGLAGFRSARSFRFASFPRLTPAKFASPGLCFAKSFVANWLRQFAQGTYALQLAKHKCQNPKSLPISTTLILPAGLQFLVVTK